MAKGMKKDIMTGVKGRQTVAPLIQPQHESLPEHKGAPKGPDNERDCESHALTGKAEKSDKKGEAPTGPSGKSESPELGLSDNEKPQTRGTDNARPQTPVAQISAGKWGSCEESVRQKLIELEREFGVKRYSPAYSIDPSPKMIHSPPGQRDTSDKNKSRWYKKTLDPSDPALAKIFDRILPEDDGLARHGPRQCVPSGVQPGFLPYYTASTQDAGEVALYSDKDFRVLIRSASEGYLFGGHRPSEVESALQSGLTAPRAYAEKAEEISHRNLQKRIDLAQLRKVLDEVKQHRDQIRRENAPVDRSGADLELEWRRQMVKDAIVEDLEESRSRLLESLARLRQAQAEEEGLDIQINGLKSELRVLLNTPELRGQEILDSKVVALDPTPPPHLQEEEEEEEEDDVTDWEAVVGSPRPSRRRD